MPEKTYHAPAGRDYAEQIQSLHQIINDSPHVKILLDSVPLMVLFLNEKRQIVAVNQRVCDTLKMNVEQFLGKRPGEVFECVHSHDGPDGCGTGVTCRFCGAVNAVLESQQNKKSHSEECRMMTKNGEYLDWKVTVNPFELKGYQLLCMSIQDISDQKRRQVLERTFFHDIVNTIGAIIGFSRDLTEEGSSAEDLHAVIRLTDELMEDVTAQRDLTLAENGELKLRKEPIELGMFLIRLVQIYQKQPVAEGICIEIEDLCEQTVTTDPNPLKRVLMNMIKNALEASKPGDTVTVGCHCESGGVILSVHNPAVMPEEVKLQIFHRSFSTKSGAGRGIGTYSMKLLGETCLGGKVSFTSEPGKGTTFRISLPVHE